MMAFKKQNRWNQRQRHFEGRWPEYQAPAQWVCVIWVNAALPGLGCCFGQGSGPSAKNADRSAHLWWKPFAGTGGGSAVTVQWTVAARHLSEPQSCRFTLSYRCPARPRPGGSRSRRALCRIPRRPGMLSRGWWAPQSQPVPHHWGTPSISSEGGEESQQGWRGNSPILLQHLLLKKTIEQCSAGRKITAHGCNGPTVTPRSNKVCADSTVSCLFPCPCPLHLCLLRLEAAVTLKTNSRVMVWSPWNTSVFILPRAQQRSSTLSSDSFHWGSNHSTHSLQQ